MKAGIVTLRDACVARLLPVGAAGRSVGSRERREWTFGTDRHGVPLMTAMLPRLCVRGTTSHSQQPLLSSPKAHKSEAAQLRANCRLPSARNGYAYKRRK